MYLYIENNIFINLKEIELLMDYKDFISNGNKEKKNSDIYGKIYLYIFVYKQSS